MMVHKEFNELTQELSYAPTDKGTYHSYLDIYEEELDRRENISLLEIGIWMGGSMLLWKRVFSNSNFYGIDNYPMYDGRIPTEVKRLGIKMYSIDSSIPKLAKSVQETFDYIIDDAIHDERNQILTFLNYYPKLKEGGKYFIEDITGDEHLNTISSFLETQDYTYKVFDKRHVQSRPDDIMVVVYKSPKIT